MTFQEAIDQIQTFIVTNGNNEITAAVLQPILLAMVEACEDTTGVLSNLNTTDKSNLVAAINELKGQLDNFTNDGIHLHSGTQNPNVVPPASYNIADFYIQVDGSGNPVQLFQWNGLVWFTVGGNSEPTSGFNKTFIWDGSPVDVGLDFTGSVFNLSRSAESTFSYSSPNLTPIDADTGDILSITSN